MTDADDAVVASALGLDFRPRRSAAVIPAEVGDELVLHDTASGGLHRLNPVGADVWALLDGSVSIEELAVELAEAYAAEPGQVRDSVLSMVRDLGRIGLLEGVPAELVVDQMALFLGFRAHEGHDHEGHDHGAEHVPTGPESVLVSQIVPQAPRYFAVPPSG